MTDIKVGRPKLQYNGSSRWSQPRAIPRRGVVLVAASAGQDRMLVRKELPKPSRAGHCLDFWKQRVWPAACGPLLTHGVEKGHSAVHCTTLRAPPSLWPLLPERRTNYAPRGVRTSTTT